MKKKAVVLLSGGLDSATTLYYALKNNYECHNIIFDYGQRHNKEIDSAKKISGITGCKFYIIKFDLPWKGSELIDKSRKLKHNRIEAIGKIIPATYVPARNTIFISFAVSFAETISAGNIFIGANAVDFSGYPDCRPDYFNLFNKLISIGTKRTVQDKKNIKIVTPLINKSKSDIIKLGIKLGVPYELTWSCYEGKTKPCLKCDSCVLRVKGFEEAGLTDPLMKVMKYTH